MTARFYKMTGSGNDFVFLDGREHDLAAWTSEKIRQVCDRRRGVGGDGVVHLIKLSDGTIRMTYFNADGSRAEMCGNAALCSTRLAVRLGLADPVRIALATDAGLLESRCVGPAAAAELKFPAVDVPTPIQLQFRPGESKAFQGIVGVPHTVIVVEDLARVDLMARGRELRFAPERGPAGSNVNFIGPTKDPATPWAVRTYERGVEGETLACGTGTIAAALGLANAGLCELPVQMLSSSGCIYSVTATIEGARATEVWLCGEGRLVFVGEFATDFTGLPE